MKFNLIESSYINWEKIHDDFAEDYLFSELSNNEIRLKYGMTHGEFTEYSQLIKTEQNITRRPFWKLRKGGCKYYYPTHDGFQIRKYIDGEDTYIGFVPSEKIAKKIVELCINSAWNIPICKNLCNLWSNLIV